MIQHNERSKAIDLINNSKTVTGKLSSTKIINNKELMSKVYNLTDFLPESAKLSERIYCVYNNINTAPICEITGAFLKWDPNAKKYSQSHKSAAKKRNLNMAKIAASRENKLKALKKRIISSIDHNEYNLICREKVKHFIDDKIVKTDYGRVGNLITPSDLNNNYDILCSLIKYTFHPLLDHNTSWSERFYLFINNIAPPLHSNSTGSKATYCSLVRGYRNILTSNDNEKRSWKHKLKEVSIFIDECGFNILNMSDIKTLADDFVLECKLNKHQKTQNMLSGRWKRLICNTCTNTNQRSGAEDEIITFLRSHNIECIPNYKIHDTLFEIDIYLPEYNIGIEYHGLLWHSYGISWPNNAAEETYSKHKHLNKYNLCKTHGIRLIQIFENEWKQTREIVESILKSKLNKTESRIYARKCEIAYLSPAERATFFKSNHIQRDRKSSICIGLKFEGEVVCAMAFGTSNFTGGKSYNELTRFANKLNTSVIGGASKIFNYYVKIHQPTHITTYADMRYSEGDLYAHLGFTLSHTSKPNYWYIKSGKLLHRVNFQKHKLQSFENFAQDKTETQIMYEAGYRKIYDAGNLVFIFAKM